MIFERFFTAGRKRRAAALVGIEARVLAECPVCRAITDTSHPERLAEADRIAAEWLVRGDGDGDLLEAGAQLADVISRHGITLPQRTASQAPAVALIRMASASRARSRGHQISVRISVKGRSLRTT